LGLKIVAASDSSLLVTFGNAISPDLQQRVLALFHALQASQDSRVRNLHPGYTSLLVDFDPLQLTHGEVVALVESLSGNENSAEQNDKETVHIPVCYDAEFGIDLAEVARHASLAVEEVVRLHSSATYRVCFLGFSPGFAYLGGLPAGLATLRLSTPRRMVAGGSVGIAGGQTGIYPVDSPGGWKLVGRTPLRMFDPLAQPPTRLQPGDRVKFSSINRATFEQLQQARG
jgi:KipI family sensor histidine kinase inhibitor